MNGEAGQTSGSKTSPSPPAKRSLELDPEDASASAPKKARLETSQEALVQEDTLCQKDTQETQLQHPQPRRFPSPLASVSKQLLHPIDPLDAFVSQWLQSVGSSERTRNCRSDSSLDHLRDEEQRQPSSKSQSSRSTQTRSAPPDMDRRDKQGFAVPASPVSWSGSNTRGRPVSTNTGPSTTTSRSRSGGASVEDPDYRRLLLKNNIDLRPDYLPMPGHVESIVEHVRTRQRDSPERTDEELVYDEKRWELFEGTGEDEVVKYYSKHVFPDEDGNNDVLRVRTGKSMARQVVPFAGGDVAPFCVPAPDMLYGYRADRAFPNPAHREKLSGDMEKEVIAINDIGSRNALLYPFFIVEYKGVGGNMWVATNQCLGGTSACISIAEKLNRRLFEAAHAKDGVVTTVDSTAFSIAMNGNEARMYVSWKQDELNYYTTNIDCYALRRPDEYRRFRRMVRNVVDWGRNDRLKGIQKGLDQLLEAAEKQTPDVPDPALSGIPGSSGQSVRQRSPPSPSDKGSSSSRSKKQRS